MRITRVTEVVRVTEIIESEPAWLVEVARLHDQAQSYVALGAWLPANECMMQAARLYLAAGYRTMPEPLESFFALTTRGVVAYPPPLPARTNRY